MGAHKVLISGLLILLEGCVHNPPTATPASNLPNIVMSPGMRISATNQYGTVVVIANDDTSRTFEWGSKRKTIRLNQRSVPFRGSSGIYSSGFQIFGDSDRIVADESKLYFPDTQEFRKYMAIAPGMCWVYTRSGLMIGWRETPERNQIDVCIYQVYIGGEMPRNLDGARNDAIKVDRVKGAAN